MRKLNHLLFVAIGAMALSGCFQPLPSGSSKDNSSNKGGSTSKVSHDEEAGEEICEKYANPVSVKDQMGNDYKPEICDPGFVRDGSDFYIFATNDIILHSTDCCNWEYYGKTNAKWQWATEAYPGKSSALWAPDAIKINDHWYYYYSVSGVGSNPIPPGIGYMVADSATGPWTNESKLFFGSDLSPQVSNCIDPHIFVDDDGSIYCTVGSFQGIYIVELEEDNGTLSLKSNNATLIAGKATGWDGNQFEGSYIIKKDGYYYYFGSHGTCCKMQGIDVNQLTYRVSVGRSKDIMGPYVDAEGNRLLDSYGSRETGSLCVLADRENTFGPGHNSLFLDDNGDYWIIYHAYTISDNFKTRHLMMDKLIWNDKGFPQLRIDENDNKGVLPTFEKELDGPLIYNPF